MKKFGKVNSIRFIKKDDDLEITVEKLKHDYDYEDLSPNSFGFFHCPDVISIEDGIKMLQEKMIKRHEEEIERLMKSLEKLKNMKYEYKLI